MPKLKLSSPWVLFYHEVEAMFKNDRAVHVVFDEDNTKIKIYVNGVNKAAALEWLLPKSKEFGCTNVLIEVIPANKEDGRMHYAYRSTTPESLFGEAFAGNPALSYVRGVEGIFTNPIYYVVFRKEVVQYFTDDLGDANGVRSTLYQEIAKEIFVDMEGVQYCTDVEEPEDFIPF
jgi:hypothetical protein